MATLGRRHIVVCTLLGCVVAVSATVAGKLFDNPILEVGEMWVTYAADFGLNTFNYVSSILDLYTVIVCSLVVVGCVLLYYMYGFLFVPVNRVCLREEVGYLPDGKSSWKDVANAVAKKRVVGEVPPVYPNGWYVVLESFTLKKGKSKSIFVIGMNLAVFRDDKGQAHILDAYCPHLGANLGIGGRVIGDCIECPFHGWQFRGHDGKCTKIPASDKIPDMAKVKSWPCIEVNGFIHVWFHAEGSEPTWSLPELAVIKTGSFTLRGRTEHYVNTHIEEISENGADIAHLPQVHESSIMAGNDLRKMWSRLYSFARHFWCTQWAGKPKPDQHIGVIKLIHSIKVFGMQLTPLTMEVNITQLGPAVVYLRFRSLLGSGYFIETITPVEPLVQRVYHNLFMSWALPTFITNIFMKGFCVQFERDVMIWNNKKYQARPLLSRSSEDALLARHRRWFSQFYSENSPRFTVRKDTLDW